MHITYDMALAELAKAVADKPEGYKYTRDPKAIERARKENWLSIDDNGQEKVGVCAYYHLDGSPGCIVGTVMYNIDPEFEITPGIWGPHLLAGRHTIDDDASGLLRRAQKYQDVDNTWERSLVMAIIEVPRGG